jgi:hypothetical protein
MSAELVHAIPFFGPLFLKMAIVALFVVAATAVAERSSALIGGLIASLPVAIGPVYVLLAMTEDGQYISEAALASMNGIAAVAVMVIVYAHIASRHPTVPSVLLALLVWLIAAGGLMLLGNGLVAGVLANLVVFALASLLLRAKGDVTLTRGRADLSAMILRGAAVAALVGAVEAAAAVAGPKTTGIFAAFPVVFVAMMVILQKRHGGKASAAVLVHALPGLAGIAVAFLVVHLAVDPLGKAGALLLGLAVSVGWNGSLLLRHLQGKAHASRNMHQSES